MIAQTIPRPDSDNEDEVEAPIGLCHPPLGPSFILTFLISSVGMFMFLCMSITLFFPIVEAFLLHQADASGNHQIPEQGVGKLLSLTFQLTFSLLLIFLAIWHLGMGFKKFVLKKRYGRMKYKYSMEIASGIFAVLCSSRMEFRSMRNAVLSIRGLHLWHSLYPVTNCRYVL